MVISRTPYRISFFGGGTDYPDWFRENGGAVLATTIDKYCYLTCRYLPPFFEHRTRILYSKMEMVQEHDEIEHPSVRETLKFMKIKRGVELHHDGDLPARSGIGSSSAFTVGLLNALHGLKGEMRGKECLAQEAIHVEQNLLKESVGSQDQVLAAFGGFNHVNFLHNGSFHVRPVILPAKRLTELNAHLMLFYTGIKRTASDIASTVIANLKSKERHLSRIQSMVEESLGILTSKTDIVAFGELMHESWMLKRDLSHKITNSHIEALHSAARNAGAIGGKLTGAGGGGFLLLFVPPTCQAAVKAALYPLIHVPFGFETSGSQVIFHTPDPNYSVVERERAKSKGIHFDHP